MIEPSRRHTHTHTRDAALVLALFLIARAVLFERRTRAAAVLRVALDETRARLRERGGDEQKDNMSAK